MCRVGFLIGIMAGFGFDAFAQAGAPGAVREVHMQLGTKNNQTVFHVGELITLQLAYSLAPGSHNTFLISNRSYDRSGRLDIESYHIEPSTGWDDPLKQYFQSFAGFIGGGLFSNGKLTAVPVVVPRDLNEWVRFELPGIYRVTVTSTRVQPTDYASASTPLEVSSNEISLQILPATPEWQAAALHDALSILDQPSTGVRTVQVQQSVDRQQAVAVLRYLGTPGAAVAMVDRLNDDPSKFQFMLGLAATPAQDVAVEHMRQLLRDPSFPVNDMFLQTLSLVALPSDAGPNRADQRSQLEEKFEEELLRSLTTKKGKALAVSAYSLVNAADARCLARAA